jgi:hypothetical protein
MQPPADTVTVIILTILTRRYYEYQQYLHKAGAMTWVQFTD